MKCIFKLLYILSIIFFFTSCENRKIEYFKLNIISSEPLGQLKENDPLPTHLISLFNYYQDTSCIEKVFVPKITLERIDISPLKKEDFEIPLTSLNQFRKSYDLLSGANLIEDYDENISKLITPKILIEPNNGTNLNLVPNKHQHVILVSLDELNTDTINSIRKRIGAGLCSGNLNGNVTILFVRGLKDSISADTAIVKFYSWKNEKQRNNSEIDSTLQSLEHQYPNDYRFTVERLKLRNEGGQIKESDEYLLLLAVEKAIKEGKAKDLLAIINNMNLPKKTKEKVAQTITKNPPPGPPINPDKAVSFRKLPIEGKLSTIADASYTPKDRKQFKDITLEYFESQNSQVTIASNDSSMITSVNTINDYLDKLRFSKNYKIKVVLVENGSASKISSIRLIETY